MGRKIEPWPKAAGDACGRITWSLMEVGHVCYFCHAGVFMAAKWRVLWRVGPNEWLATPRNDIDLEALETDDARRAKFKERAAHCRDSGSDGG